MEGRAMTLLHRSASVLLVGFLGFLGGSLTAPAGLVSAQPPSVCAPPVPLVPPTKEPELAGPPFPKPGTVLSTVNPDDPPTPVVTICVRVPAQATAGQELEYRICLENRSAAAAHHVIVRNPLPATARFVRANSEPSAREPELQWQLGTLEGGARREILLVLSPTGADDIKNCARVQFEHGQCVTTKVARP